MVTLLPGQPRESDFWAITTFYNPAGYQRRLPNYRQFRQHLGVPLLAVELSFTGDFSLTADDADIVVHLNKGDILWQKERLLNLAIRSLPPACRYVAWLDCDVIFERSDWAERSVKLLEHFALVQPFGDAHLMPTGWSPDMPPVKPEQIRHPPAYFVERSVSPLACLRLSWPPLGCSPGLAWVARRDFLEEFGLYDSCIVGGGDSSLAYALYGCFELATTIQLMTGPRQAHYMDWAMPLYTGGPRQCRLHAGGALPHLAWQSRGPQARGALPTA